MAATEKTRKTSQTSTTSNSSKHVPKTFEEFLLANNLQDWPEPITSEGPLDIEANNLGFGNPEDICKLLSGATQMDYTLLDDIAKRLDDVENLLKKYADTVLERPQEQQQPMLTASDEQVFLTETKADEHKNKKTPKHQESISDIKKRTVDFCEFPGFLKNELNELPGQLEAPQVLNAVTNVQDFNSGFKKFWHKIFLSEASVAVMQDLFWWFFIDKFDPEKREDKNKLFDRIADSFVALFFSVNQEIKDKVFQVYAECLAQAVLVAFHNAFPESTKRFDDRFIDDLVNICVEWTSGVKPAPESWRQWDIERLVRPPNRDRRKRKEMNAPSASTAFHGGQNLSLDMDSFHKVINQLGNDRRRSFQTSGNKNATRSPQLSFINDNGVRHSHPVGPGAQLETVSFDTLGQSALVSHFLRQRKLQDAKPNLMVKRTQVAKLPEKRQTYQELIEERTIKSQLLSQQYQQAAAETEEEINRIQREKAKMNREINQLSRQILFNKNPLEIKIMSERVMDMMEQKPTGPQAATAAAGKDDGDDDESSTKSDDQNGNNGKLRIEVTSPED